MRFLWNEYLVQSAKSWQNVAAMDWVACRTAFHNWRSSSQVFGMDDFAQACLVIEERILSRRFAGLEKMVAESRGLYEQSINDVAAIFLQMEEDNEETGCKR